MRGDDPQQAALFSYLSPEERVPKDPPLRAIRAMVDEVLTELSCPFDARYADTGRPSMAPEQWLRVLRLPVLDTIRRERLLLEQLDDHLLCRWVVGLNMDDVVWDYTVFSKHRERLLAGEVAQAFFDQVLAQAQAREWLSDVPFTVDGARLEAWAGQKRLKRKELAPPSPPPDAPGHPSIDCRGERRTNATQPSTTDPEARLYKKKPRGKRPSGLICGMCSWTIGLAWWWIPR